MNTCRECGHVGLTVQWSHGYYFEQRNDGTVARIVGPAHLLCLRCRCRRWGPVEWDVLTRAVAPCWFAVGRSPVLKNPWPGHPPSCCCRTCGGVGVGNGS